MMILFLLLLNTFFNDCFSQERNTQCDSGEKNNKRYEIAEGSMRYEVYSLTSKGRKKNKLFNVEVLFQEYGKYQKIDVTDNQLPTEKGFDQSLLAYTDSGNFFLNFFVPDTCSGFYSGISLIKPIAEKYDSEECVTFVQFRFTDNKQEINMGTVKYCKGIPVYIKGGLRNKGLVWELQKLPKK